MRPQANCQPELSARSRGVMPASLYKKGDELGEGLHLNRWKVVRKIGEGQFAEVYEVVDAFKDNKRVRKHPPCFPLHPSSDVPPTRALTVACGCSARSRLSGPWRRRL